MLAHLLCCVAFGCAALGSSPYALQEWQVVLPKPRAALSVGRQHRTLINPDIQRDAVVVERNRVGYEPAAIHAHYPTQSTG